MHGREGGRFAEYAEVLKILLLMRMLRIVGKLLAGLVLLVVVLLVVGAVVVNSSAFQQRVLREATQMLSERLQTTVSIDSVDIRFRSQQLRLYGLHVADLQQRPMLTVRQAGADVDVRELLSHKFTINYVELIGARALLLKPSKDSAANYQFLIDAFKKPKVKKDTVKKTKNQLEFDIRKVKLEDVQVVYNDMTLHLGRTQLRGRKGCYEVDARLHLATDNHKPRKNAGKPKRGFFDAGHLDLTCGLQLTVDARRKDTLRLQLADLQAVDSVSGIDVRHLRAHARLAGKQLWLNDVVVQQKRTQLHIHDAQMQLPSKKDSIPLSFHTGAITGTAYLQDISRSFAPVLSRFSLPLYLSLTMSGNDNRLQFHRVRVTNGDKRLQIAATGDIQHLKSKEKMAVNFRVSRMTARSGVAANIISQFPVKQLMMKQLNNLGDLSYTGRFRIIRKQERFWGTLGTAVGSLNFLFWLDEWNKYVIGNASTRHLDFVLAMCMKDIGALAAKADFKIDISKPRTAIMRRRLGGKLPIGSVNAEVADCSYKGVHVRNISARVESNGALASGEIIQRGNWRDLSCSFSFSNTDDMQKLKISKGRMKFHKMSDEAKQAKRERKEAKKAEKAKRKEAKKAERAAREARGEKKKSIFNFLKKSK